MAEFTVDIALNVSEETAQACVKLLTFTWKGTATRFR